ncbi:hypothetical protein CFP56_020985 [Quercus suber]|uniref:F-box protein n=1 Tax=Quercus suber TaxID=58331 RepID=A0AAW0M078_QUESU
MFQLGNVTEIWSKKGALSRTRLSCRALDSFKRKSRRNPIYFARVDGNGTSGWTTLTSQSPFTVGGRLGIIHIDTNEGRVPTMPFVGHLKPLENDVDAMNMVKCIRCYNEVEVYVMFLDDYENAIGNKGDGGGGDNEVGNFDVGDKVDGAVSEEDNAHRVHFGCSENKQEKRYDRVKLKERRKGKAGASGVSPSRVGGSGVDPSGVSPSEAGASGVGLIGIDARGRIFCFLAGDFVINGTHFCFLPGDTLRKNPLLPYWGTCFDVPGPIGEESSTSSIDAWSVEEESFASLPSMVFDMLDSLEEESSTSFTRDVLLETLERFRKSLLLPNRIYCYALEWFNLQGSCMEEQMFEYI